MYKFRAMLAAAMMFAMVQAQAQPASPMRVRGTITAVAGHELEVKTREGKDLKIAFTDATRINVLTAIKLKDIKRGSFVGVTAVQQGPGTPLVAREVHLFPEAQRGTGEGHYDWDLEPGSSMTNANVDAIVNTNNGRELTLGYKGGRQQILVPRDVPVVSFKPADPSLLKAGAHIFCITQPAADGTLTAQRISVGKNGLKPPM
jgi:hypothetical protein